MGEVLDVPETPLAPPVAAPSGHAGRRRTAATLAVGFTAGAGLGALWGAQFRGWMRFVSTDPEFTWSGTLLIVILMGAFGATQGLAWAGLRLGWRGWRRALVRVLGVVGLLPTTLGAGMTMAPCTLAGSLAAHRSDWPRAARVAAALAALANLGLVSAGVVAEVGGVVTPVLAVPWLAVTYAAMVAATAGTFRPGGAALRRAWLVSAAVGLAAVIVILLGLLMRGVG
jgi:hypothetical protein